MIQPDELKKLRKNIALWDYWNNTRSAVLILGSSAGEGKSLLQKSWRKYLAKKEKLVTIRFTSATPFSKQPTTKKGNICSM